MSQISTLTERDKCYEEQGGENSLVHNERGARNLVKRKRLSGSTRSTGSSDLMGIVSSKIRSLVTNGSLTYDQGMVAARHFDVKRFEMEVHIWLGFTDTQKVDYIESVCRSVLHFF
ncbi:hypothetical protein A2U01_0046229 [Trifolium medium]|uniref:Uncharacterized protein n=1 Tax=Trifolium medium TaxID=97028 RepID=A0A392QKX3_9FABA|nr:hypothetical protein [Trifolium medium]